MRSFSALAPATALIVTAPIAAFAASGSVEDPSGDGSLGKKLDVTSATLRNNPKGIKIVVKVEQVASGSVYVYLKPKGHKRFTVTSEYDPVEGTIKNGLIKGGSVSVPCSKINATWSTSGNSITIRMPANCVDDGEYDDVKYKLATERLNGRDVDFAPQAGDDDTWLWSPFIARG